MRFLSLCLASVTAIAIAASAQPGFTFRFAKGVIVDPEHARIYLMAPGGAVQAVDPSSGRMVARTARAAEPLLLDNGILLARSEENGRRGVLDLVGLDATDLAPRYQGDVPLPGDVEASIDDRPAAAFNAAAQVVGDKIVLRWQMLRRLLTGMPRPQPARVVAGFAVLDPNSGRLAASGSGAGPAPVEAPLPADVRKLLAGGALIGQPCAADGVVAAPAYVDGDQQRVLLRRWEAASGKPLPAVPLFGSELTFRNFSADCRHLLASGGSGGWVWHLFETATGRRVAEIRAASAGARFFIWKDLLIAVAPPTTQRRNGQLAIETPPRLVATDLHSGVERWAQAIRETRYLGPYPGRRPVR